MSLCAVTLRDRDNFVLTLWSEVQQQEVENAAFTGIPSKRLVKILIDFRNVSGF